MAKAQSSRTKAETLSLRVAPDLKFGLDLLSRLEDRSLTTIVERSLRDLFLVKEIKITEFGDTKLDPEKYQSAHFAELLMFIWSVDGPTRLFRTAILFPSILSVKDMSLFDLIFGDPYFKGTDKIEFAAGNHAYETLFDELAGRFWKTGEGIDLKKVRRNWTKMNDLVDSAMATGHFPESYDWD
ncbi:hypothetical protein P0Y43_26215 [Pseudomonas entomophila]|uniref:hypothetical protein n=1 Tax=Pseudomonas entomophila TaxID=312306 RepID=UPI0023D7F8C0|nr:hypothetical protein [Pseudomonas entomophila]MDF0734184.1 hypothetical protein [Pseudomonas entomophila]